MATTKLETGAISVAIGTGERVASPAGVVTMTSGVTIDGAGSDMIGRVSGTVLSTDSAAVFMQGGNLDFAIWSGGRVGGDHGMVLVGSHASFVQNHGAIGGVTSGITVAESADMRILNTGQIEGGSAGIAAQNAANLTLDNHGGIFARDAASVALSLDGNGLDLKNAGTVMGAATGLRIGGEGSASVTNSGFIGGVSAVEILTNTAITNTGDIVGATAMSADFAGRLDLVNYGSIVGTIGTAGQDDRIVNRGEITGDVGLGGGADRIIDRGTLTGRLDLGGGDDTANIVNALGGRQVQGGAGNDNIYGSGFEDELRGGQDRDVLQGRDGDDRLIGGAGRDQQTGGAGADMFIFQDATDSTAGAVDVIRDFERGLDVIDLRAVSGDVLAFAGEGEFIGGGVGSVAYRVLTNGAAVVKVDVDGDGSQEMRMVVKAAPVLDADDFLL